jgi:hypothetical protein
MVAVHHTRCLLELVRMDGLTYVKARLESKKLCIENVARLAGLGNY